MIKVPANKASVKIPVVVTTGILTFLGLEIPIKMVLLGKIN